MYSCEIRSSDFTVPGVDFVKRLNLFDHTRLTTTDTGCCLCCFLHDACMPSQSSKVFKMQGLMWGALPPPLTGAPPWTQLFLGK